MNNAIEKIQEQYGLTKEQVRRAQISFSSNLTGRFETTGSLNGQSVVMYFRADGNNHRGNIVHVYQGDEKYTDSEWVGMAENMGFDNRCLDREYIEDVVLNTDKDVIDARLKAMKENISSNRVIDETNQEYYIDLLKTAIEISKTRAEERQ